MWDTLVLDRESFPLGGITLSHTRNNESFY